jgi:hypothetical protein
MGTFFRIGSLLREHVVRIAAATVDFPPHHAKIFGRRAVGSANFSYGRFKRQDFYLRNKPLWREHLILTFSFRTYVARQSAQIPCRWAMSPVDLSYGRFKRLDFIRNFVVNDSREIACSSALTWASSIAGHDSVCCPMRHVTNSSRSLMMSPRSLRAMSGITRLAKRRAANSGDVA